jgi:hypothetical protein
VQISPSASQLGNEIVDTWDVVAPAHPDALIAASTISPSWVRPARRHQADSVELTRLERSNEICFSLLGPVQCADGALGQGGSCFTRERARDATAADFGRSTRRGSCVVKDSPERIVRENYDHDALAFLRLPHLVRAGLSRARYVLSPIIAELLELLERHDLRLKKRG